MDITSDQIRAARALLRLEQAELARQAHVSVVTIRRVESQGRVMAGTLDSVRRTLERAGVEFIPDGVRRNRSVRPDNGSLYQDLHRISLESSAVLNDRDFIIDRDLYDEDGLPA